MIDPRNADGAVITFTPTVDDSPRRVTRWWDALDPRQDPELESARIVGYGIVNRHLPEGFGRVVETFVMMDDNMTIMPLLNYLDTVAVVRGGREPRVEVDP